MARLGSGYIGTDSVKTSTANLEIIPTPPSTYQYKKYSLYKFSFVNGQDCTVVVNGETTLFIPAGQGFEIGEIDQPINSFVIKEAGVTYTFVGGVY
jgi:hypothetical protein